MSWRRCVFRCQKKGTLFSLPKDESTKNEWLHFIFNTVPEKYNEKVLVCAEHFNDDCFTNLGAIKTGHARQLLLKSGAIPSVKTPRGQSGASDSQPASTSKQTSNLKDVDCQTKKTLYRTVGTQLSRRTLHDFYRSKGVQTEPWLDIASSCSLPFMSSTHIKKPSKRPRMELEEEDEDSLEDTTSTVTPKESDVTFDPAETDTTLTEPTDISVQESCPIEKIKKYIVYETCIMELFEMCPVCRRSSDVRSERIGTFLRLEQFCNHCQYTRKWSSQPIIGSTPAGNLQLSAAVYLSGESFFRFEKICTSMNLQLFKYDTFRRHARLYIEPAVVYKWKHWQNEILHNLSEKEKVIVGGDMRADSPGQSAKFGSYTMMELDTNVVVDIQLVQSNEVGGSYHMEKEGLQRSLALLKDYGVRLECIITDRHPQIQKYLRECNITQFYDVWHLEKEITKKLDNIAKSKECEKIRKWMRSIKNHIYWTAASSSTAQERVAKWTSILNHVRDIHTHEDTNFPSCLHDQRQSRDCNKWLVAETPAFYNLEKVLTNKRILKDVMKLSPHHQTSNLESFHSVIQRFSPKNVVFPFLGMLCRLYLAAFHYNENAGRPQATSMTGEPLYRVSFPKAKRGQCTVKPVKTPATFRYLDDLQDLIIHKVFENPTPYMDEVLKIPIPPDLYAGYERPDKEELISRIVSRFNQAQV